MQRRLGWPSDQSSKSTPVDTPCSCKASVASAGLNVKFDILVLSEIWDYSLEFYGNLFKGYKFYYEPQKIPKLEG